MGSQRRHSSLCAHMPGTRLKCGGGLVHSSCGAQTQPVLNPLAGARNPGCCCRRRRRRRRCHRRRCRAEPFPGCCPDHVTSLTSLPPAAPTGHLELQATSLLLERNIRIYQAGQPVWRLSNFDQASRLPAAPGGC